MPLYPERKGRGPIHAHRFNRAIGRMTLGGQPRGQPVDTLAVQGIDPDLALPGDPLEYSTRHEPNRVTRTIALIQVVYLWCAVIVAAGDGMHLGMQRAAKRIQLLKTSTNG